MRLVCVRSIAAAFVGGYVASRVTAWTRSERPVPAPTLELRATDLEIIDVPSPTGTGTIRSLARRPHADPERAP